MEKNIIITALVALVVVAGGLWFGLSFQRNNFQANLQNQQNTSDSQNSSAVSPEQMENPSDLGLGIEILKEGSGEGAKAGDLVTVNYVGTLADGTKFDSSIDRGQPFSFTLGQNSVIQGWEKGVLGMKVGEKRKLTIPPELGYGSQGAGGVIPPNATLVFEVDMLKIGK